MSPLTKIRVALVGLEFGSGFVPLYPHHPNVEYLAICDLNEMKQIGRQQGSVPMPRPCMMENWSSSRVLDK